MLVHAVDRSFLFGLRAFAYEPQEFADGITYWSNGLQPSLNIVIAPCWRLSEPVTVFGQVELAGTARN